MPGESTGSEPAARAKWRERAVAYAPFALFALSPLVAFPRGLIEAGMLDGGDDALSNLPLLVHSARAVLDGNPFWTDALFLGTPLLAEPEFATFYPFRFLILLFAPVTGFGLYVLLHYVAAQATCYAYLRTVGLARASACFGALAYGYSGFMLGHRGHTMYLAAGALAPLLLYFLERVRKNGDRLGYLGACVSFALVPFAGAVQLAVYLAGLALGLYAALALVTRSFRPVLVAALALAPGLLLSALQLVPAADLSSSLGGAVREEFAFAAKLSWHPYLLPTLFLPLSPFDDVEFYSRAGTAVICGGATLALGAHAKDSLVRAWSFVALAALLLMMGRYVPVLARALHHLPVLGVLRGPVRHNFELGLALSVLGAFGFEAAFAAASQRSWRWLMTGAVAVVLVAVTSFGFALEVDAFDSARLFRVMRPWHVWVACSIAAFWFASARMAAGRARAAVVAVCALLPLIETKAALWPRDLFPKHGAEAARADFRGNSGEPLRILPWHINESGLRSLGGNAALLFPNMQHLHGYASIAPRDPMTVLDLDMHGHARDPVDLAWSRLPSVFGTTHLILPKAVCGTPAMALARAASMSGCGESSDAPITFKQNRLSCREPLRSGVESYRVEAEPVRALDAERADYGATGLSVVMPELAGAQKLPVALHNLPERTELTIGPSSQSGLGAYRLRLVTRTLGPVVDLARSEQLVLAQAERADGVIRLRPASGVAQASVELELPKGSKNESADMAGLALEMEARSVDGSEHDVVLDLYAGAGFDPDQGQIVLDLGRRRGEYVRRYARIKAENAPPRVQLRVYSEGAVDVRLARLVANFPISTAPLGDSELLFGWQAQVAGDIARFLDERGRVLLAYSSGCRPIEVALDVEAKAPSEGLRFGVDSRWEGAWSETNFELAKSELAVRSTHTRVIGVPPGHDELSPHVGSGSSGPIVVHSLAVKDACSLRKYEPLREVGRGLWLNRNPAALPRAFTVDSVRAEGSLLDVRRALRGEDAFQAGKAALVADPARVPSPLSRGTVEESHFDAERVRLRVRSPGGPTYLVVNDRFDRGWEASVDGRPVEILKTNGIVRGVVVPAGEHRVEMRYRAPRSIYFGALLAVIGVLLAAVAFPRLHQRWALGGASR